MFDDVVPYIHVSLRSPGTRKDCKSNFITNIKLFIKTAELSIYFVNNSKIKVYFSQCR